MTVRRFIPGSEWLYLKIYTGAKSADSLLTEPIRHLSGQLLSQQAIDSFFFIRYNDPDFHLRLRLHLPNFVEYSTIMHTVYDTFSPLIGNNLISDLQCGTYVREIERYGERTIEAVERFFFMDSYYEIELLRALSDSSTDREQSRWLLALRLVDDLCNSFRPEASEKQAQFSKMASDFKQEFGFTRSAFTGQLNDLYREHRKAIAEVIDTPHMTDEIENILQARKTALTGQAETIRELNQDAAEPLDESALLWSLLHMTLNRWFRTRNRLHEMVIYEFVGRYYESLWARRKYN